MEKVIYTAIIGPYETLKEPLIITPGWKYICFTDQPFISDVWRIRKPNNPNYTPQMFARYLKIMFQNHLDADISIWVDGSFTINTDLNDWVKDHHKGQFSAPKHPWRNDVFEEAQVCIAQNRGDKNQIIKQMNFYLDKVPRNNGLIQSGILIRTHTDTVKALCQAWWMELLNHSVRDQIGFAKASMDHDIVHTYPFDYSSSKDFIFKKHDGQK